MEGLVVFNKPKGITSYKVVEFFKNRLNKKVGHGGTLDKLAEGILILAIDEYTKELNKFLKESIKTYIAEITLGAKSNTYDSEGEITDILNNEKEISQFKKNYADGKDIMKVLNSFVGEIEQMPPSFSAVKIKGKPAYSLARKGKKIELKPRKVKIFQIKMLDYKWPKIKIEVVCSSGTYIRSLANDLGEKLGCGGYLSNLIRTKILLMQTDENFTQINTDLIYTKIVFDLEQALTFDDIERNFLEFYAKIYGKVQGVGFRFFTEEWAKYFNIKGYVKNLFDGSVEVLAQGKEEGLQELIFKLKQGPTFAKVEKMDIIFKKPSFIYKDFLIL